MSYRLKYLIDKLIMKAFVYPEIGIKYGGKPTPGRVIKSLSKEERELLKKAKAKDFYHRI